MNKLYGAFLLALVSSGVLAQTKKNDGNAMPSNGESGDPCEDCTVSCVLNKSKDPVLCAKECIKQKQCPKGSLAKYKTGKKYLYRNKKKPYVPAEEEACPRGYSATPKLRKQFGFSGKKPNIVLILLDDQDHMVSPFLEAMPFTKKHIYDKGVSFEKTISPSSVCCAGRCQILTGLYPHNVGVTTNAGKYGGYQAFTHPFDVNGKRIVDPVDGKCINYEDRTVSLFLQKKGAKTAILGKYVNGFEAAEATHHSPGWSDYVVNTSTDFYLGYNYTLMHSGDDYKDIKFYHYGYGTKDYGVDVVSDEAQKFINKVRDQETSTEEKRPLFMYVSSTAPHLPLAPARRHEEHWQSWHDKFDTLVGKDSDRKNYFEKDIKDKSLWLKLSGRDRMSMKDSTFIKSDFASRMTSLMAVDEMVEGIYKNFEERGEIDNTVFVLTSDNGYNLGAHRLLHKMAPYEESNRVPLIISGPGFKQKVKVNHQVAIIDLAPTFLELSGIVPPSYMDGRSLLPLLLEETKSCEKPTHATTWEQRDIMLQYGSHGGGETVPADKQSLYNEIPGFVLAAFATNGLFSDVPPYIGLRTHDDKLLVRWYGADNATHYKRRLAQKFHQYELYDMKKDPEQLNNLASIPEYKQEVKDLNAKMLKMWHCKGKDC